MICCLKIGQAIDLVCSYVGKQKVLIFHTLPYVFEKCSFLLHSDVSSNCFICLQEVLVPMLLEGRFGLLKQL